MQENGLLRCCSNRNYRRFGIDKWDAPFWYALQESKQDCDVARSCDLSSRDKTTAETLAPIVENCTRFTFTFTE